MEGELWQALYRMLRHEAKLRNARRRTRVIYSDGLILLVYFWSVLHDRPRCWACRRENWPAAMRRSLPMLPSESTLSRRMRSVSVMLLLASVYHHLAALRTRPSSTTTTTTTTTMTLVRAIESKPLPVG